MNIIIFSFFLLLAILLFASIASKSWSVATGSNIGLWEACNSTSDFYAVKNPKEIYGGENICLEIPSTNSPRMLSTDSLYACRFLIIFALLIVCFGMIYHILHPGDTKIISILLLTSGLLTLVCVSVWKLKINDNLPSSSAPNAKIGGATIVAITAGCLAILGSGLIFSGKLRNLPWSEWKVSCDREKAWIHYSPGY